MSEERKLMEKALKEVFIPELRERSFNGSFPHFRRIKESRIDFLTIQFNSAGGSFVVEIAKFGPNGIEKGYGSQHPVKKLNVQYFRERLRLGTALEDGISDYWFEFGRRSYDEPTFIKPYDHYLNVASSVLPYLDSQAEKWWSGS